MKAIISKGLPGSGKSTWARQFVSENPEYVIVNNDTIRNEIYVRLNNRNWSKAIESEVGNVRTEQIAAAYNSGQNVILDNTHMNPYALQAAIKQCEDLGFEVEVKEFDVPVEECIRRDSLREGHARVGEEVIRKMVPKDAPKRRERKPLPRWVKNPVLPNAIIVDLDGTLFENVSRDPFDEKRVGEDIVREHVLRTITALHYAGAQILFVSGRSEDCRVETTRCLWDKCALREGYPEEIGGSKLFMRPSGDKRRDSIIKREIYEREIKDKYSIIAVFDDRQQVIRECWAALNLPVFRCGVIDEDDF